MRKLISKNKLLLITLAIERKRGEVKTGEQRVTIIGMELGEEEEKGGCEKRWRGGV